MKNCPESRSIQDYLEGELSAARERAFRAHLGGCERCTADLALYRRAFECLDRLPLAAPAAGLTERILDRVAPSRVRRRWVATFGWSYAGALAASLAIAIAGLSNPGAQAALTAFSGEVSARMVQGVVFALNVISFALLGLADGWGAVAATGERFAPIGRVLASLVTSPVLLTALLAAMASCTALFWWLRPREKRSAQELRHVGLLGF
jgi:hypothetical protein